MSKDAEKLSGRLHTDEFDNQNLLKCNDNSADRISLQEYNLYVTQRGFKGEKLSLMEEFHILKSYVQNED